MSDRFLSFFNSDTREAERKFELLRQELAFFFQHNLVPEPEDRAREVLSRVLGKLPETVVTHEDLVRFCYGVVRPAKEDDSVVVIKNRVA